MEKSDLFVYKEGDKDEKISLIRKLIATNQTTDE